jgi:hypothetical protein
VKSNYCNLTAKYKDLEVRAKSWEQEKMDFEKSYEERE